MTSQLPPNLLRLFAPRPPLVYLPPIDKEFRQRRRPVYTGVGGFLGRLDHDQDYQPTKTLGETKRIQKKERAAKHAEQQTRMLQEWDPSVHPSDAFKTLIVANLVPTFSSRTTPPLESKSSEKWRSLAELNR